MASQISFSKDVEAHLANADAGMEEIMNYFKQAMEKGDPKLVYAFAENKYLKMMIALQDHLLALQAKKTPQAPSRSTRQGDPLLLSRRGQAQNGQAVQPDPESKLKPEEQQLQSQAEKSKVIHRLTEEETAKLGFDTKKFCNILGKIYPDIFSVTRKSIGHAASTRKITLSGLRMQYSSTDPASVIIGKCEAVEGPVVFLKRFHVSGILRSKDKEMNENAKLLMTKVCAKKDLIVYEEIESNRGHPTYTHIIGIQLSKFNEFLPVLKEYVEEFYRFSDSMSDRDMVLQEIGEIGAFLKLDQKNQPPKSGPNA